jgi:hypothetical protein
LDFDSRSPGTSGVDVQFQAVTGTAVRNAMHFDMIEAAAKDPTLSHVYFDISWDEVAKYAVASPEAVQQTARMLNQFPDRFLFGTDNVAPQDQQTQLRVFHLWDPVWRLLTPEASFAVRKGNYERLFDEARVRVRAWEAENLR